MSSHAEDVLYLSLTDTKDLETLATIGLTPDAIPTEEMRPVVAWAIERFFESGRTRAPTRQAMLDTWGTVIDDARIELLPDDEDTDTIQWAIGELKSQYVHYEFQSLARESVTAMSQAHSTDRVTTLKNVSSEYFSLSQRMQPQHMVEDLKTGMEKSMASYMARVAEGNIKHGMLTGLGPIDDHTFGFHPGELVTWAAGPKTGKSWWMAICALAEWRRGRRVVLYTLENSVQMTMDRIICLANAIEYRAWQRGTCTPEEYDRAAAFVNEEMHSSENGGSLQVVQPEMGMDRTVASMVRNAQMLDVQSLLIDQLTFIEHPKPDRKGRPEIIRDILHELKPMISTAAEPISAMIAHQINRGGVEAARKVGHLYMEHLAESSEVERTSDWVFGMYQSAEQRKIGLATVQTLAARREDVKNWELLWEPAKAACSVSREITLEAAV